MEEVGYQHPPRNWSSCGTTSSSSSNLLVHHHYCNQETTPTSSWCGCGCGCGCDTTMVAVVDDDNKIGPRRIQLDAVPPQLRQQQQSQNQSDLRQARHLLYLSHAVSQFTECLWQFVLILFLAALCQYESLILVSTFGLAVGLSVCLGGSTVGRFIVDGLPRRTAAQVLIATENLSSLLTTILSAWLLLGHLGGSNNHYNNSLMEETTSSTTTITTTTTTTQEEDSFTLPTATLAPVLANPSSMMVPLDVTSLVLLLGIHIFGSLAQVLARGYLVAIERDWVVVMSTQATAATATATNYAVNEARANHPPIQSSVEKKYNHDDDDDDTYHNDVDSPVKSFRLLPSSSTASSSSSSTCTAPAVATEEEPNTEWLSETNVIMRQIDLLVKILSPAVASVVIGAVRRNHQDGVSTNNNDDDHHRHRHHNYDSQDLMGAAILVVVVTVAAFVIEWMCTVRIDQLVPALGVKNTDEEEEEDDDSFIDAGPCVQTATISYAAEMELNETSRLIPVEEQRRHKKSNDTARNCTRCGCSDLWQDWREYFRQPVAMAGLGFALLHLNALTLGGLMTGALVWRGMRLETVGMWRGASAAVGLVGTVLYLHASKRVSQVALGLWSVTYQFVCLSVSLASFLVVSHYNWSMAMLLTGVCASRVGLWVFDISVTQLMQEFVPARVRGSVGGTQQSLNALFQLLSFALGLLFPDPRQFPIYASAGYAAVGVAVLLYFVGVVRRAEDFLLSS